VNNAVLCYIDNPWAFFTTQPLEQQMGDDWDDPFFKWNAGEPYEGDDWQIIKVAFDSYHQIETADVYAGDFSVEVINAGAAPWLQVGSAYGNAARVSFFAGGTLAQFIEFVEAVGGNVYVPRTHVETLEQENAQLKQTIQSLAGHETNAP
jgi:hypothetical protein